MVALSFSQYLNQFVFGFTSDMMLIILTTKIFNRQHGALLTLTDFSLNGSKVETVCHNLSQILKTKTTANST